MKRPARIEGVEGPALQQELGPGARAAVGGIAQIGADVLHEMGSRNSHHSLRLGGAFTQGSLLIALDRNHLLGGSIEPAGLLARANRFAGQIQGEVKSRLERPAFNKALLANMSLCISFREGPLGQLSAGDRELITTVSDHGRAALLENFGSNSDGLMMGGRVAGSLLMAGLRDLGELGTELDYEQLLKTSDAASSEILQHYWAWSRSVKPEPQRG